MSQPIVCLLLNKNDRAGVRLFHSLQKEGVTNLKMISAEELVYAEHFQCVVEGGKAHFDLKMQNGVVLNNENIKACLNRICFLPSEHIDRFKQEDRQYVYQEMAAIFTFVFSIMPNQLFNAATGLGFSGRSRGRLQWLELARAAGFETLDFIFNKDTVCCPTTVRAHSDTPILFFNGKSYAPGISQNLCLLQSCNALGSLSGERILEIHARNINERWYFTRANTLPDFNCIGADFLADLKMLL